MLASFLVTQKHRQGNLSIIFVANKWWIHDANLVSLLELKPLDDAVLVTLTFHSLQLSLSLSKALTSLSFSETMFSILPSLSSPVHC